MNRLIMSVNSGVVDLLHSTLEDSPMTEEISLEYMFIEDILPIMDLLSKFKNLKILNLHGNRLKGLPIDMSCLKFLEELHLSNNMLSDPDVIAVSLATLPSLKILKYPVSKEKEVMLIERLKKLKNLNATQIIREYVPKKPNMKYMNKIVFEALREECVKNFRKLAVFESSYLEDKNRSMNEQKFRNQLNTIIQQAFVKFDQKQGEITNSLEFTYYNITRYQMYEIVKNRAYNICMDIYGELGKFLFEMNQSQDHIWRSLTKQSCDLCNYEKQIMDIQKQKLNDEKKGMKLEDRVIKKNFQIQKQLKRLKKHKDELIGEISKLENQNTTYLEALVKYSKGDKRVMNSLNSIHPPPIKNTNATNGMQSINTSMKMDRSKNAGRQISSIQMNYTSNGRNLSIKQLKDTIEQIYQSKLKYDQKNFDGKLPRETMHQYLFTYLNQKYGLKNLTIQAASSIVSGIQAYSPEDNDVAVFGKILRNQIDEEFRNVQSQLKSTISSLLKMHIKNQHNYKSASEIDAIFKQKTQSEISSEEVEDIVKYLYNKTDSQRILKKIQVLYRLHRPREEPTHRRLPREEQHHQEKEKKKIKFSRFSQAVLDFQLKNHEKLLKPLVSIFRERDSDSDGIVNEDEFIAVIEQLCEEASDIIPELLMIVDPYETKTITFTQMVRLVANYPENSPILSRFIEEEDPEYDEFE